MKKLIALIAALMMTFGAFALSNPVVPITDDDDFEDKLDIEFDADDFYTEDVQMNIISDNVGEVVFTLTNVNGEDVEWCFRFTKDASIGADSEALTGIYDSDCTEPVVTTVTYQDDEDDPTIDVAISRYTANTEGYDISVWQVGDVYYSMSYKDNAVSQMTYAEVMDHALEATLD